MRMASGVIVANESNTQVTLPTMRFLRSTLEKYLQTERRWIRDFLGELIGTTLLVAIVCGNTAQAVLSHRRAAGDFFSTSFVTAMSISFGVYLSGNTSGGHINPAVTMVMVLVGRTKWRMLPVYWVAQYFGAFLGAALVYAVYYDAIKHYDHGIRRVFGPKETASIFACYPQDYLSTGMGWFDQAVGTAILTMCVFAIHDKRNVEVPQYLMPLIVGLVVMLIGMAFGLNLGAPLNPARDLGPRIFTAIAGWGSRVFSFRNYNWFWVPLLGPHVGAVLGTVIYMLFVGFHWPETFEKSQALPRSKKVSNVSTLYPPLPHRQSSRSSVKSNRSNVSRRRPSRPLNVPDIRIDTVQIADETPVTSGQLPPQLQQQLHLKPEASDNEIKILGSIREDREETVVTRF